MANTTKYDPTVEDILWQGFWGGFIGLLFGGLWGGIVGIGFVCAVNYWYFHVKPKLDR